MFRNQNLRKCDLISETAPELLSWAFHEQQSLSEVFQLQKMNIYTAVSDLPTHFV